MMATRSMPRDDVYPERPPNGSSRGKRAYVLFALIKARPRISRSELIDLLGWDEDRLDEALRDLEILLTEAVPVDA